MATILEVTTKYCNNCHHRGYCYRPCAVVIAAMWDLPCEKELLKTEEERKENE